MNSSNHNSSCNFSDLLISYLYGEIGEQEKLRFESHASGCKVCGDEISVFGGVRSSVQYWRETEFARLPSPVIELPFEAAKKNTVSSNEPTVAAAATTAAAASRSWLTSLRQLFSFSPAWTGAATACAALAICVGLFYAALSSLQQEDGRNLAGANKNASVSSVPSPPVDERNDANGGAAESGEKQPGESPKPENKKDKKQSPSRPAPAAERIVVNDNTGVKSVKTKAAPKPPGANKEKPSSEKKAPKQPDIEITTRVEEDKSLRLTDLFDDVSMR